MNSTIPENSETKKLRSILLSILELDESIANEDITRDNLEVWDSARHLNLIMEVEAQFKISFKIEEVNEIRSFEDIWLCVENKK